MSLVWTSLVSEYSGSGVSHSPYLDLVVRHVVYHWLLAVLSPPHIVIRDGFILQEHVCSLKDLALVHGSLELLVALGSGEHPVFLSERHVH